MTSAWPTSRSEPSAPSAKARTVFPALDVLRFVGATLVLTTHVAFQTGNYSATLVGSLAARFDVGVAIFFVLSGFLLSRPYLRAHLQGRPIPRTGRYLWHRFVRIAPVYLVTVILVLSLIPPARGPFWPVWVENLTLTTIYTAHPLPEGLTQMWSLATEVAFYAILPFLMLVIVALGRRLKTSTVVYTAFGTLVALNVVWYAQFAGDSQRTLWLPAFLSWFACGILASYFVVDAESDRPHRLTSWATKVGGQSVSCFVLALVVLLLASTPLAGPLYGEIPTEAEAITKNILYAAIGIMLVMPAALGELPRTLGDVMTHPVSRYLGRISYGIFCLHLLVLYGAFHVLGQEYFAGGFWLMWTVTMAASIAVASVAHYVIELPAERLRNFGSRTKVPTSAPKPTNIRY